MATLNWIGKEAVVNHDKEVPFKLLEKVPSVSVGKESKNLIIHGDNLEALKALMPFYKGKVKCIYIDPPYNTGNEKWKYNDNVNSPKIREWIGKVVGPESEDLTRHDKWLCMMYPRLKLLKDLLTEDGAIFISIDYNEEANARVLLAEIFGANNYRNTFAVARVKKNIQERERVKALNFGYNSIIFFANSDKCLIKPPRKYQKKEERWHAFDAPGIRPSMEYEIFGKRPPKGRHWMYSKERTDALISTKEMRLSPRGAIQYLLKASDTTLLDTDWTDLQEYDSQWGYPNGEKNVELIKRIVQMVSFGNDLILDSFAGSGTTAHAVLDLNRNGGNRNFILVEMENDVAEKITAPRIKKVIKDFGIQEGFEYCELAKPLFNEKGQINEKCSYNELASYIYFTETQTNLDMKAVKDPFVGESHGTSYYLVYTGKNKNDLTRGVLSKLKITGQAVIYADRCLVDEEELKAKGIVFKQIPYEIKVY